MTLLELTVGTAAGHTASRTTPLERAAHTDLTHAPGVSVQNALLPQAGPRRTQAGPRRDTVRQARPRRDTVRHADARCAGVRIAGTRIAIVRSAVVPSAIVRCAVGCVTVIIALDPRSSSLSRRAFTAHLPWRLRSVWCRAFSSNQTSPQARMTARQDGEVLACMAHGLSIDRTPAARGAPFPKNPGFTNLWCGTILRPRSPFNSISKG